MAELEERDTQTKVKHEILDEYLIKWGSIITRGLKGHYARHPEYRAQFKARFVYVDYFSFMGAYRENGQEVSGSPLIGVKRLDEIRKHFIKETNGLSPSTNVILFEEKSRNYETLLSILRKSGFENRVKETSNFSSLQDGDIAVVKGDSSQYVDAVLAFINRLTPTYSFHLLDPYGFSGIERNKLEKILSQDKADCIVNMMLQPISRWISVATKTDLTPKEKADAIALDKFFGSPIWRDIQHKIDRGIVDRQEANEELVNAFDGIVRGADKNLAVKQIPLRFQDRDETVYYLFLATRDPSGSFAMNQILADARIREYDYRSEKLSDRLRPGQQELAGFFSELTDQNRPTDPDIDIDFLTDEIYAKCKSRGMKYREVLLTLIDTPYFESHVRTALGRLKQKGRATFKDSPSDLRHQSEITFL